ncbi:hypothetical protein [uncultured Leptotrichia sp.]|uniref:hypothetical protein n=1 Tax=uncultured Leptotrichia sp. TaxID=159271 RepID=UPI0025D2DE99|nr:hypothetical protein [uncultured Leptotrichia sp.]
MKKIIFLILGVFIMSSVGYSEVRNINGIIFDDRIFGETGECKLIGATYLMVISSYLEKELLGRNSEKVINDTTDSIFNTNRLLKQRGWNKYTFETENINSYYKTKCRKIKIGDIKGSKNDYEEQVLEKMYINTFYQYMKGLNMLEY